MAKTKAKRTGNSLAIPTVPTLDLNRFEGRWYELAHIQTMIAKDCVGTSTTYSRDTKGKWKIACDGFKATPSGQAIKLRRKLRIPDATRPGEMEACFIPFIWVKYRIVYVSADYRYMLVTSSSMHYLWLMGTERNPPDKEYKTLVWRAKELGFDTALLKKVDHSGITE